MKKKALFIFSFLTLIIGVNGQFVSIKSGIQVKEYGSNDSKNLTSIPYGIKLENYSTDSYGGMTAEGLKGNWRKITFNEKTGFIFDGYLLPIAPPDNPAQTLENYIDKNYKKIAGPTEWANKNESSDSFEQYKQTIYDNGIYIINRNDKTLSITSYYITGLDLRQAFHFCKLFTEFEEIIGEKNNFPLTEIDNEKRKVKPILNPVRGKEEMDGIYIEDKVSKKSIQIKEHFGRIEVTFTRMTNK